MARLLTKKLGLPGVLSGLAGSYRVPVGGCRQQLAQFDKSRIRSLHLRDEFVPGAFAGRVRLRLSPQGHGGSIGRFGHIVQRATMDWPHGNPGGGRAEFIMEANLFLGLRREKFDHGQLLPAGGAVPFVASKDVRLKAAHRNGNRQQRGGKRTPQGDGVSGKPIHSGQANTRRGAEVARGFLREQSPLAMAL